VVPTQGSLFVGDTAWARALYVYSPERQSWGMCTGWRTNDTTTLGLTPDNGFGFTCVSVKPAGKAVLLRAKSLGTVWLYATTEAGVIDSVPIKVLAGTTPARTEVTASVTKLAADQTAPALDSTVLSVFGSRGARQPWAFTHRPASVAPWMDIITDAGYGPATLRWRRSAFGRSPGTYVDTLLLHLPGLGSSPIKIIDTLVVTAAGPALAVSASPAPHAATLAAGSTATVDDSALITLSGTGAASASWTAQKRRSRTTLLRSSGVSSGYVVWRKTAVASKRGVSVDTITISVAGAAGAAIDAERSAASEGVREIIERKRSGRDYRDPGYGGL
jgi:hypothetical protein